MKAIIGVRPAPHRIVDDDGVARPFRWHLALEDRVALEAALQTAETTVAVGIGGKEARDCVRSALEMGVDDGLVVSFDPIESIATEKYATVLARVTARESADAIFVGESASLMGPEVAGLAGETLGWPTASHVTAFDPGEVESVDLEDGELAVRRKLATGRQELLAVSPPAVFGIDSGFANPRRSSLRTAMAGRRAEIRTIDLGDVVPDETRFSMSVGNATVDHVRANERWGRASPPRAGGVEERIYRMLGRGGGDDRGGGEVIDAPPEEAAERVVAELEDADLL